MVYKKLPIQPPRVYYNSLSDPAGDAAKGKGKTGRELNPAERRFLREYLSHGNATVAARNAFPKLSDAGQYHKGLTLKRSLGGYMEILMDQFGLDDVALIKKLKEGMEAAKIVTSPTEGDKVIPDYATQHKFLTTAAKWRGLEGGTNQGGSQTNIGEVKILVTRGESLDGT